jgi:hypothetical protein
MKGISNKAKEASMIEDNILKCYALSWKTSY